jgi:glycogen operon protein
MTEEEWGVGFVKSVIVFLNGAVAPLTDIRGEAVRSPSFCMLFNAHHDPVQFRLPSIEWGDGWGLEVDTDNPKVAVPPPHYHSGEDIQVPARAVIVLVRRG